MKKVVYCYYVHKTNMDELPIDNFEDSDLLSWAISYMYYHNLDWDVCKYDSQRHTFSLIMCPTWDVRYEPIIGDSYLFRDRSAAPRITIGNKTVYHQKHLFVNDAYDGFDIMESKKRTELLESIPWYQENKSRIGSLRIWEEFLKIQGLEKYMP